MARYRHRTEIEAKMQPENGAKACYRYPARLFLGLIRGVDSQQPRAIHC
mgnify:CR=1 FL=1